MSDSTIRVMTFNVRYRTGDAGRHRWERRRAMVVQRIRAFDPDLLGLQECNDDAQLKYLCRQLSEWQMLGVRTGDERWPVEVAPVLHKTSAFERLDAGHFWLSETPLVAGSRSWDSVAARTATWVRLRQRSCGRSLTFLNTHVDYAPEARERSSDLLRNWILRALGDGPLIVAGDFNADKASSMHRQLVGVDTLFDVSANAETDAARAGTFHGYGEVDPPEAIDWILTSREFRAVQTRVDDYQRGDRFPSDHYPLTAVVSWRDPTLPKTSQNVVAPV